MPCLCTPFIVLHALSLSLRPVDQQRKELPVRVYTMRYSVISGVGVSGKGFSLVMNEVNLKFSDRKSYEILFSKLSAQ